MKIDNKGGILKQNVDNFNNIPKQKACKFLQSISSKPVC